MPPILCTPWLVCFLAHAARKAVLPQLEPGEGTVGVVFNAEHLAATPLDERVVSLSRIIETTRRAGRVQAKSNPS